jgi:hypothetical protein
VNVYTAIRASSVTIAELLRERFVSEPALETFFGASGTMTVSLATPEEMDTASQSGLSVWLYRIARDEQRLNAPVARPSYDLVARPRLPLRLYYLMTPIVGGEDEAGGAPRLEQEIMGKVVQTFHDLPIVEGVLLRDDLAGTDASLKVRWETKTTEEITRIWDALELSYQLCVSYEVSLVFVDSDRPAREAPPIDSARTELGVARRDRGAP